MNPSTLTITDFQKHIEAKYAQYDRARDWSRTFAFFIEEIGELATALSEADDRQNLEEEFADVVAWLCTLANVANVDLAGAIAKKYLGDDAPAGHK